MVKNEKYANLLIKKSVRRMLRERGIKANAEVIEAIDHAVAEQTGRMIDTIAYQLRLEGRKTIKKKDLAKSLANPAKGTESFEI